LLTILLAIAIAYVLILLVIRAFESRFVFFPNYPGRLDGNWHPAGLPVQDVWLHTADGVKLHAWWIPNPQAQFTFLAFHGNASNIANRTEAYGFLHATPGNVLAVEYRGYGHSEGAPGEAGIYRDADAGYQYLIDVQHLRPNSIISFGQSLGSGVATDLAARRRVAALVLEGSFPSAAAVAKRAFPFLPGLSLLVHGQLDTETKVQRIGVPVLVVHCTDDPVLPFAFGERVFAVAREPKVFLPINGSCHEEASMVAASEYRAALNGFLASLNH